MSHMILTLKIDLWFSPSPLSSTWYEIIFTIASIKSYIYIYIFIYIYIYIILSRHILLGTTPQRRKFSQQNTFSLCTITKLNSRYMWLRYIYILDINSIVERRREMDFHRRYEWGDKSLEQ